MFTPNFPRYVMTEFSPDPPTPAADVPMALDPSALPVWSRRLRECRTTRGLSQQELADLAGLSLGTISAIERGGHSSTESLGRLAEALGQPLSVFFMEDDEGRLTAAQTSELITRMIRVVNEALEDLSRRRRSS